MNAVGTIYKITNRDTGKVYIGQTTDSVENRWRSHLQLARRGQGHLLHSAIRKYGSEKFAVEPMISALDMNALDDFEKLFISTEQSLVPKGYNLESGGNKYKQLSAETKEKLSLSHLGKPRSLEVRQRLSEINTGSGNGFFGKKHTEESRQKMTLSHLGRTDSRLGKVHSAETKQKLSIKLTGRKHSVETRTKMKHSQTLRRLRERGSRA